MQSMGVNSNNQQQNNTDSSLSTNQNTGDRTSTGSVGTGNGVMQRHHSTDSMCSLNSLSSGCSAQDKNKKKKGWVSLIYKT